MPNKASIATLNKASAYRFLAINNLSSSLDIKGTVKSTRKLERINTALNLLLTSYNPVKVITILRLRLRFAAKGQS